MIQISQISIPVADGQSTLKEAAAQLLGIKISEIRSFRIVRQSIDARKKNRYNMFLL